MPSFRRAGLLLSIVIFSGIGYHWLSSYYMVEVEDKIEAPMKKWSPPTGQVKPLASCTCPAKSYDLSGSIPTANREDIQKRRAEEYKKHQARESQVRGSK
ncbi:unnamed protein product [Boreogadus saida]